MFTVFVSLDSLVVVMTNVVHGYITFLQFYALVLQFYSISIVVSPYLWYKRTLDKSNRIYPIIISSVKRSCKLYKQLQLLTHNNTTFFIFSHTGRYGSLGSYYLQYEFGEHETENRQNNKMKSSYAIQTLIL